MAFRESNLTKKFFFRLICAVIFKVCMGRGNEIFVFLHFDMNVSLWISRRLRLGGNGSGSPVAVVIAVAGVALAVMVMEFTLAVVTGFKDGIRAKVMGFDAQISVLEPLAGRSDTVIDCITLRPALDSVVRAALPPAAELRLSMRQPGMIKTDDNFQGVVFYGQSPEGDFSFERGNIVEGQWPDYAADSCDNMIVLSRPLARSLGLGPGDRVYSTFVINGDMKLRRHTVAALYESNFGEYDNTVVYASLRGLQRVAGIDSLSAGRIDVRGLKTGEIEAATAGLKDALLNAAASGELGDFYPVDNVFRSGAMYFNWLSLLDTNVTVIFILMLAVAGFTLVSSLFILILERVRTIGILRALGATKADVRSIFVDLGFRLVGRGLLIGNIVGIALLSVQQYTHLLPLDPAMYYLSAVPVKIVPWQFVALNFGIVIASWLILIVPARVAASTDPAKAIETE